MKKRNRKMFYKTLQNISYLMFVIGAAGVGGDDMLKAGVICLVGAAVLGTSALLEGRRHDKTSIKRKRYCRDMQRVRKHGVQNHKAA